MSFAAWALSAAWITAAALLIAFPRARYANSGPRDIAISTVAIAAFSLAALAVVAGVVALAVWTVSLVA